MEKIWDLSGESPNQGKNPAIILSHYAKRLKEDTNGVFRGLITDAVDEENSSVTYALYVVVPELKNYMYRLIELKIENWVNLYPVELKLLAKEPKNNRITVADNPEECELKLEEMIKSPITKMSLQHLKTLIEIVKDTE